VNEQQAQFDVVNHKLPLLYRSTGKVRDFQNLGQTNKKLQTRNLNPGRLNLETGFLFFPEEVSIISNSRRINWHYYSNSD